MNIKMISPQEVIEKQSVWRANPDKIEYNQLEGFVRQIIGWRVHARYLLEMPEYATMNLLIMKKNYLIGFGQERPK
jgi:deoxyribodipyrimidine photolyase-related protein